MTKPTQAAIEAARERLAKFAEAKGGAIGQFDADSYRSGDYDVHRPLQALAIALQEMSDAVKGHWADLCIPERFAPFILPDPVDPLLIEGRKIANEYWPGEGALSGNLDGTAWFKRIYETLRRGMELAKVQP